MNAAAPPQDLAAERAVLGGLILEPGSRALLSSLRPTDFMKDAHRRVFEVLVAMDAAGQEVDLVLLGNALEERGVLPDIGGRSYLALLVEEAALATTTEAYVELIVETGRKRALAKLGYDVATAALNGKPAAEIVRHVEEILVELRAAPVARPEARVVDATDLLAQACEPRPSLVAGIVERRTQVIIGGAPKLGKTALGLGLFVCCCQGRPWLDFATMPGVGLFYQAEIPPAQMRDRLRLLTQDAPLPPGRLFLRSDRSLRLDTPDGQRAIRGDVERVRPDLVAFDPLARFMTGDENSTRDMGRVIAFLDELIQTYDCTTLVVHHTGKPSKDDGREGGQRLRGSSALFAAADSVLLLDRQRRAFVLSFQLRHAPEPDPLILTRTDRLTFEPAAVSEELQAVADLAGEGKRFTPLREDLQELQGVSKATAARLIGQARKLGLVAVEAGVYRSHGITRSHADRELGETPHAF